MFISHKSNVLQTYHDTEWQCRRMAKNLSKAEYWAWLDTITTQDEHGNDVVTYPSEDFTIVECMDENLYDRLVQLDDYVSRTGVYNIKYYASKRDSEIVDEEAHTIAAHTDEDGNDVAEEDVATTYVQSHFVGQDDTMNARIIVEKWETVRMQRNSLIAETDYLALSDQTLSAEMTTYRQDLRDVPTQGDPDNISWPTKP